MQLASPGYLPHFFHRAVADSIHPLVQVHRHADVVGHDAQALDRARITTNYNAVPFDPRKPFDPSGIRLGTPAVTTRGMAEAEMRLIAAWIDEGVEAARRGDEAAIERIAGEVRELAVAFPIPGASM